MQLLLDSVNTDTVGSSFEPIGWPRVLMVWGSDFGEGSVSLQISPDNGTTWVTPNIDGQDFIFTSNSYVQIPFIGAGMLIRAVLSGSSGASDVNAAVYSQLA